MPSNRSLSASMTSNLSAKFTDGRAREFIWGITLSKDEPEYTWSFEEEDEDKDFLEHTLFLRHAVLGESATQDERNVVTVETKTFSGEDLKQPLFSLTLGKTDMCQLDINFGHEVPVVFKLTKGAGPVHISAQQLVEFPPENLDETEMTDYTATEEECSEADEDEDDKEMDASSKGAKGKKRKVSLDKGAAKKKKGKAEETSDDEEDEEEDEDEDESMDEEDDDDDDEEDEEEEPTPEKKKPKGGKSKAIKGKKAQAKPAAKKGKKKSK